MHSSLAWILIYISLCRLQCLIFSVSRFSKTSINAWWLDTDRVQEIMLQAIYNTIETWTNRGLTTTCLDVTLKTKLIDIHKSYCSIESLFRRRCILSPNCRWITSGYILTTKKKLPCCSNYRFWFQSNTNSLLRFSSVRIQFTTLRISYKLESHSIRDELTLIIRSPDLFKVFVARSLCLVFKSESQGKNYRADFRYKQNLCNKYVLWLDNHLDLTTESSGSKSLRKVHATMF